MFIKKIKNMNNKGFTLIETLVVMAIFSLFAIVIANSLSSTLSYNTSVNTQFYLENEMQYAMSYIKKIIRNGSTSSLTTINTQFTNTSNTNPFEIYNLKGNVIAEFFVNNDTANGSSYIEYSVPTGGGQIEITNPSQINITKLEFYYDNYDFSGAGSHSFTPKIPPYVSIYMQGCALHKFGTYGTYLCLNLVSSVTLENYVYAKQ